MFVDGIKYIGFLKIIYEVSDRGRSNFVEAFKRNYSAKKVVLLTSFTYNCSVAS